MPQDTIPQVIPSPEAGHPQPAPILPEHLSSDGPNGGGNNFAPLKPLLALQRGNTKESSSLQDALKERFQHHYRLERKVKDELDSMGFMIANFIMGRHFVRPNPWLTGQWLPYTPQQSPTTKRALNFVRFWTTNQLWKWGLSNPDVIAIMGIDTEEAREAAEAADVIIEHYERKFFKPFITIQEALDGLCWGNYIWDIRYDDSQHSMTALRPLFQPQQVTMPGTGFGTCGECGFSAPAEAFPNPVGPISPCPECGGQALVEGPATAEIPSVVGMEEIPLGDLTAKLRPFAGSSWDLRYRVEDSSWFIGMQRTSLAAVHRLLGNIRLPNAGEGADNVGLNILDKLPWMGESGGGRAAIDNRKRNLYEEPVTVVEYSLSADDIADIVLRQPEETIDGQTIEAGPLLNTFPNGLVAQGLNGLNVITGIFAEHHRDALVSGVWHANPGSGTGQGLNDLIEVQKRFNSDDSVVHDFMRANSTPAMLVRQEALGEQDRAQYLASPRTNIPINSQNLPENLKLEDIVRPAFTPQNVPGTTFQYIYQKLNDFAQLTSHITDFTGGMPGVKNSTATGAQITQANSNALFTPVLQMKGEVRLRIAQIVLALYRRHFPVERYFPLKGRYGRQQGRYLSGANLSTDITLEVVRDSELPRNSYTKREDYTTFLTLLGGVEGYKMARDADPEFVVELERAFNFPMKSETYNQIASLCQQRLQQMKTVAELVPDPTLVVMSINPPLAPEELNQELKAKWFAEWLDDDEGQRANPVLRMAVQLLIQQLFGGAVMQGAQIAAGMGAVAAAGGAMAPAAPGGGEPAPGNKPKPHERVPDVNHPTEKKITGRPE